MATVEEFETAAKQIQDLPEAPSTDRLLELYALYKQATTGDVSGTRPGMLDPRGRAKWDAWSGHKGMTQEAARTAYIELAKRLGA